MRAKLDANHNCVMLFLYHRTAVFIQPSGFLLRVSYDGFRNHVSSSSGEVITFARSMISGWISVFLYPLGIRVSWFTTHEWRASRGERDMTFCGFLSSRPPTAPYVARW